MTDFQIDKVTARAGFSLIELLVTLLISGIAILGMVALQGRAQQAQLETLQRGQAMALVEDMANRISANPENLDCYNVTTNGLTGSPFEGGAAVVTPGGCGSPIAATDLTDWHNALLGAGEVLGGVNVGGLINARGCIRHWASTGDGAPDRVQVMISWQGTSGSPIAPGTLDDPSTGADETLNCATGEYTEQRRAFGVWLAFATADTTP